MRQIQKLVAVENDGFRHIVPVMVRGAKVVAAAHCHVAGKQFHALQTITEIVWDESCDDSGMLALELLGKIKEGFIISPVILEADSLPQGKKISSLREVRETIEELPADFWLF